MSNRCICLHGFGENANVYSLFVAQMEKIMPCTAINLMGHGDNRSENYVLSEALRVLDDAISSSTDDEILLVGTSFGGILSYIFSSDNYDQFSSNRHKVKGLIINDVPCCIPAASFTNLTSVKTKLPFYSRGFNASLIQNSSPNNLRAPTPNC